MPFKLSHLHVKTQDPQKTVKWWVENFGAKTVSEGTPSGSTVQIDLHGIRVNVSSFVEGQTRPQKYGLEHIAISVPTNDLNNLLSKLKTNGARLLEESTNPRTGRRVCFIETPEGIQVEIMGEG